MNGEEKLKQLRDHIQELKDEDPIIRSEFVGVDKYIEDIEFLLKMLDTITYDSKV